MRPHISMNVNDVNRSVEFYEKVFGVKPQKQTPNYAKFDIPFLNFTLQSGEGRELSKVNHLGIEVHSTDEVKQWETSLVKSGVLTVPEEGTNCCFAKQDKVWFQDPDGNSWEIFVVHQQLPTSTCQIQLDSPLEKMKAAVKGCC